MTKLATIEGIGPTYQQKLEEAGVKSVEALREACATPKGREELAANADISPKLILEWANRADLFRVKGIGEEYSDLLEAAGVDTVVELGTRNADNLYAKIKQVNAEKKLVRKLPSLDQVKDWVDQAKALPRGMSY